ncbi:MAG: TonB-dependent receptor [Calditrichaeota bacterium]|nr:TonB-dependent receptor [Calditrichota bacterium]MCB9391907.1 TonB-dependent receptor [Calditrichota bacterium]
MSQTPKWTSVPTNFETSVAQATTGVIRRIGLIALSFALIMTMLPFSAFAKSAGRVSLDLADLSIEELMNIEITSVSKKAEKLSDAAAAVFVLTSEDIVRSGFSTIPEVLRLVPGLQVARIDISDWAISSRGFNGQYASKLLVMIDGRSVYSPSFSGVYWDQLCVPLQDIARIEVIRGPGATLWGANAVNGVINIITKDSRDTQGGYVQAGAGTSEKFSSVARFGGSLGSRTFYRAYGSGFDRTQEADATYNTTEDYWKDARFGLRLDHEMSESDKLQFSADWFDSKNRQAVYHALITPPYLEYGDSEGHFKTGYAVAKFSHNFGPTSDFSIQSYYDFVDGEAFFYTEKRNTFDIETKHRWQPVARNEIIWGLGYRNSKDDMPVFMSPEKYSYDLFSAFAQDELTLVPNHLRLIVGSKFEHNTYTHWEIQPNVRGIWTPNDNHSFWAAVSRAARTPSRGERAGQVDLVSIPPMTAQNPSPLTMLAGFQGSTSFGSEYLTAHEIGWKSRVTSTLNVSADLFHNKYSDLRTATYGTPEQRLNEPVPYVYVPVIVGNSLTNESYGCEALAEVKLRHSWRVIGTYSYLLEKVIGQEDLGPIGTEHIYPKHQAVLRNSIDLKFNFTVDGDVRYVGKLANSAIDEYVTADVRIGYSPVQGLDVFIVGQNLFERYHKEFDMSIAFQALPAEVERTVYFGTSWSF